ncbi:hypothetical protein BD770DRAFT_443995 [Pilaira anomala]|nr:hypothetical protein BD770DRAFT_443995 [Pilaira anomala]
MARKTIMTEINDESAIYKADATISLYDYKNLEVLLLETSGYFGNKDSSKISFDHHKGLFGALSMLKAIADNYEYGSIQTFKDVKVFFTHAAGRTVRLWSKKYIPEGPLYELWLEESLEIKISSFKEKDEQLPAVIKFYWTMKKLIEETVETIKKLKCKGSQ